MATTTDGYLDDGISDDMTEVVLDAEDAFERRREEIVAALEQAFIGLVNEQSAIGTHKQQRMRELGTAAAQAFQNEVPAIRKQMASCIRDAWEDCITHFEEGGSGVDGTTYTIIPDDIIGGAFDAVCM